jgi:YHS domain-containing protein
VKRILLGDSNGPNDLTASEGEDEMEIDPVCGMEVDPATAEWKYDHEGKTYYFCAKGCMEDFVEDPASFIS